MILYGYNVLRWNKLDVPDIYKYIYIYIYTLYIYVWMNECLTGPYRQNTMYLTDLIAKSHAQDSIN